MNINDMPGKNDDHTLEIVLIIVLLLIFLARKMGINSTNKIGMPGMIGIKSKSIKVIPFSLTMRPNINNSAILPKVPVGKKMKIFGKFSRSKNTSYHTKTNCGFYVTALFSTADDDSRSLCDISKNFKDDFNPVSATLKSPGAIRLRVFEKNSVQGNKPITFFGKILY